MSEAPIARKRQIDLEKGGADQAVTFVAVVEAGIAPDQREAAWRNQATTVAGFSTAVAMETATRVATGEVANGNSRAEWEALAARKGAAFEAAA